jgi:CheY-like chemotaxis protein
MSGRGCILVVDDDQTICDLIDQILTDEDYTVTRVTDAAVAL